MSKAKHQTPRSSAATPKATPRDTDPSQSIQLSVLVLQADALEHDEAVRQELKRSGFTVKHQALINLSMDTARKFVLEVCNPHSAMYQENHSETPEGHGEDVIAHTVPDEDKELDDHAIHALASGPALVLGLEKANAVAELLHLVGPAHPAAWVESSSQCLRARFAKDAPRKLGLRCSAQEVTTAQELSFLLAHSGSKMHVQAAVAPLPNGAKTAAMGLDQLLDFLFPKHLQHPNSAGRLFVFGLYGPLDAHSRLRSGESGLHVVTDRELTTMSARMEREDILAVYGMCSLSQEEEEEVVRQVDHLLKRFPQYTPRDIETLFAPLPRDSDGHMSFHDMQRAVMKERLRRVLCMKERLHPALAEPLRNQFTRTLTRQTTAKGAALVNGAPSSLFLKDVGATNVENAALVSRLLSTRAFQICQMEDGNSPSLTQNVRLLRPDKEQKLVPWDHNCQKRKQ